MGCENHLKIPTCNEEVHCDDWTGERRNFPTAPQVGAMKLESAHGEMWAAINEGVMT